MSDAFDLTETYVHLERDARAALHPVTETWWDEVMAGKLRLDGWLVGVYPMTENWTVWERHPAGAEVLTLLSGAIELILEEDGGPRRVALRAHETAVVPPGTWHTADVREAGALQAITFGDGTEHCPRR